MARKRHKAEIVSELRQVEVLTAQGRSVAEAVRSKGAGKRRWNLERNGLLFISVPK